MYCPDNNRSSVGGDSDITLMTDTMQEFNTESVQVNKRLSYSSCTENFKVYLRVRPTTSKNAESTISVLSDDRIRTTAPDSSKRAQYTKTESRVYVSVKYFIKFPDIVSTDCGNSVLIALTAFHESFRSRCSKRSIIRVRD